MRSRLIKAPALRRVLGDGAASFDVDALAANLTK